MSPEPACDAFMISWSVIPTACGGQALFGFALQHPRTGGMAWTRSSQIVEPFDDLSSVVVTASGTRWHVSFPLSVHALPHTNVEARVAFALLFEADGLAPNPPWHSMVNLTRDDCVRWLTACKVSRHLILKPPEPDSRAVDLFLRTNEAAYLQRRNLR